MTEFLIIAGVIIMIGGLFYVAVGQHNRQLKQVENAINDEATTRGLKIKKFIYPSISEWSCKLP